MQRKKWLLTIVLIVFVINISFFILIRSSFLNNTVQEKVSSYLKQNMNAEVSFGSFSFNDKQLKITDLSLNSENKFNVNIAQIYVEYNLPKLLFSRFQNLRAINSIKIFEPQLKINIEPTGKKAGGKFTLPDISAYFRKLQIFDGQVKIQYFSEKVVVAENLQRINVEILNTKKSNISFSAAGSGNDSLFATGILDKGEISELNIEFNDFSLDSLYFSQLEDLQTKLDLKLSYVPDSLGFSGKFSDIHAVYLQKELKAKAMNFAGDNDNLEISFNDLSIDNLNFFAEASVINYQDKYPSVAADVNCYGIPMSKYLSQVKGAVDVKATVVGQMSNPNIDMEIASREILAYDQRLSDVKISAGMQDKKIFWSLLNAGWRENSITGNGSYEIGKKLIFDLNSSDFVFTEGDLLAKGDLLGHVVYDKQLKLNLISEAMELQTGVIDFEQTSFNFTLIDSIFNVNLKTAKEDVIVNAGGNLKDKFVTTEIRLKRFELSRYFSNSSLPILSGIFKADYLNRVLSLNSMLHAYDRDFGKLSGRLSSVAKIDFQQETTSLKLNTFNAKYNFEPFSLSLQASGSLDSLQITEFNFNNQLFAAAAFELKPELKYDVHVFGKDIKLKEIAKFFLNYAVYNELMGSTTIDLTASNRDTDRINGFLEVKDFTYGEMRQFDGLIEFSGNSRELELTNSYLCCESTKVLDISSQLILQPELQMNLEGRFQDVALDSLFTSRLIAGNLAGDFQLQRQGKKQRLDVNLQVEDLTADDFKIDLADVAFTQLDSLLIVNKFLAKTKGKFLLSGSGAIGYNLFNSMSYPDTNSVNVSFEGDLLDLLAANIKAIQSGSSNCDFSLDFEMLESGIFLKKGRFNLNKGVLQIKDQPASLEKITIQMNVENNALNIEKFKFALGDGRATITNEITNSEKDFILGKLNLGRLLMKTNISGLQIYIPGYNPQNSFVNVIVTGRYSDFLEINGPFDDLLIYGTLIFFNGDLVYPPNTENLLKLFNQVTTEKKSSSNPLPLSFDLKLELGENVRYVTYPIDVKLKEGGYIHLRYKDEKFLPPDGLFVADEGSIDMFGTNLTLDYLQVELSQFRKGANINGTFFKKTADGTLITLEIFNDETGTSNLGNLRFELNSDNPGDLITDILAKLRYNSSVDDISPAQRQTLLQDEVIQIAGLGLQSAVLDPLISPVENSIRKLLRLDYFHLQTDLIQNLFATYSSDQKNELTYDETQTEVNRLTSELFLNNLSISAGKYVTRKLFFDYEIRFQREYDIAAKNYIGIFQDFSLRYDLPWKLRLSYKFSLLPFDEKDEHQIGIERSFKF